MTSIKFLLVAIVSFLAGTVFASAFMSEDATQTERQLINLMQQGHLQDQAH
ncbi:MAG: hypothetical protein WCK81_10900 [Betaproteobacteria bacterium]